MDDIETIEGVGEVVRVQNDPPGMGVVFTRAHRILREASWRSFFVHKPQHAQRSERDERVLAACRGSHARSSLDLTEKTARARENVSAKLERRNERTTELEEEILKRRRERRERVARKPARLSSRCSKRTSRKSPRRRAPRKSSSSRSTTRTSSCRSTAPRRRRAPRLSKT
jgi:hypothetical protein